MYKHEYIPLSSPPVAIPLRNMNTPSIAAWIERGRMTVAVHVYMYIQENK